MFLMDLLTFFVQSSYFGNTLFTVPDPGKIENLVSGPFQFLIEYPWPIQCACVCASDVGGVGGIRFQDFEKQIK